MVVRPVRAGRPGGDVKVRAAHGGVNHHAAVRQEIAGGIKRAVERERQIVRDRYGGVGGHRETKIRARPAVVVPDAGAVVEIRIQLGRIARDVGSELPDAERGVEGHRRVGRNDRRPLVPAEMEIDVGRRLHRPARRHVGNRHRIAGHQRRRRDRRAAVRQAGIVRQRRGALRRARGGTAGDVGGDDGVAITGVRRQAGVRIICRRRGRNGRTGAADDVAAGIRRTAPRQGNLVGRRRRGDEIGRRRGNLDGHALRRGRRGAADAVGGDDGIAVGRVQRQAGVRVARPAVGGDGRAVAADDVGGRVGRRAPQQVNLARAGHGYAQSRRCRRRGRRAVGRHGKIPVRAAVVVPGAGAIVEAAVQRRRGVGHGHGGLPPV